MDKREVKIEHGIALPPPGHRYKGNHWASIARGMIIGDSVLMPTVKEAQMLRQAINKSDRNAMGKLRKQNDGWRVWKVKLDGTDTA